MQIDLAGILASMIEEAGGEIRTSFPAWLARTGEKALTITVSDDGQEFILGLIDVKDVPEDVK